jgi:hypothetical protein
LYSARFVQEPRREGAFFPQDRENAAPRLQGRAPARQGVRDLQIEPAFQGPATLRRDGAHEKAAPAAFLLAEPWIADGASAKTVLSAPKRPGELPAMNRLIRCLFTAALVIIAATPFVLPAPARAESIHMKVQQEQGMNLPRRGLTMAQVERQYGAPVRKLQTRGGDTAKHPPINRWEYASYIVYFERNHVIHAVVATPETSAH